ncbi:hypothetical protein, partial [uncultured Desulfovibrio sp.]|uniref:hypothetical protein n=1 Tax=uncultured Desulfovibrio sp. TaxID=167968 RepID=UPI00272B3BE5
ETPFFAVFFVCYSLSGTVGATTLTVAQMPTHNHTGNWATNWANTGRPGNRTTSSASADVFLEIPYNGSSQEHVHAFSASAVTAENLPPYYAATYIMRCA